MPKQFYFNKVQQMVQLIGANTTVIVAGRRTGKTYGCASPFVLRNMERMEGSTGGIVVPTYKHGLTNTLPGLFSAWQQMGIYEGIHYVVGKIPPKQFKKAKIEPREFEHVISFFNGSRAVLISQDRPGTANSLTLDWLLIDEAKFIDFQKLKDEVFPANGGTKLYFGRCSFHHSIMILSDMPQSSKGSWFLNYREKMDPELIKVILSYVYEIWQLRERAKAYKQRGEEVPKYIGEHIRSADKRLNQLRACAVYYKEYSSLENIDIIGPKYIAQMKRDLPPLTFWTSIMSKRIEFLKDGFYSSLRASHIYSSSDFSVLDKLGFNKSEAEYKRLLDSQADADIDPNKPICIGMDYNANINWIVAGQPDYSAGRLRVLKSFYVKFERKIPELIYDFCTYYKKHANKTVVFYYDSTALGNNYAVNKKDFKEVIKDEFRKHHWRVIPVYMGSPMKHNEKYLLIGEGFEGRNKLMPMINRENNEDLLLALQTAGIEKGRNGFHKHKAGEKLPESEENLLEHRTDGTDAFDTLYIGCNNFPRQSTTHFDISGVL